jgi:hypothetical protein
VTSRIMDFDLVKRQFITERYSVYRWWKTSLVPFR